MNNLPLGFNIVGTKYECNIILLLYISILIVHFLIAVKA